MENNLQAADSRDSPPPAKRRRTQFGFKELASGIDPYVDIVAIHGIDGDRDGSWTAENGVLWLRDLLPAKIPDARILTYGYDANTHNQNRLATDFLHDHAMNLVSKLALLREISATVERPIIFVAHSFGGLLLKSALIHSHLCNDSHLKSHRAISSSTHAVAFFGTPHLGSATAELARSILDTISPSTPTNPVLLRHLERDSEVLQHQLIQYSAISGQFETKFFYEIYDTYLAGVSKRMVPRTSAVVPGAVNAEAIGIHKDHAHMVKFPSVEDEDFRTVSSSLSLMSKAACQKAVEKEDRHKRTIKSGSSITRESGMMDLRQDIKRLQDALPRADEARFDMGNRHRCMKGTRVELLDIVFRWALQRDPETSASIFWLCGQAGTGKTTISSSVADHCNAERRLGASFFLSRDREDRSNIRLVFPTIAYQLGTFCKEFAGSVAEVFSNDPDLVQSDPPIQLEKLIINPLKDCASFPLGTVIVIDALDECKDKEPTSTLLSILSANLNRLPQLKFFITSRPEEDIQLGFEPLHDVTQSFILHHIDASTVDSDIGLYLRENLAIGSSRYRRKVGQDWPPAEKIESLVQKSSGLFIFAATAIKFILDPNYRDPKNQLEVLLKGSQEVESESSPFYCLDQLYLQVLRQAYPETTPSSRFDSLKMIIGAIVLLRNPLSLGDLGRLLGLDDLEIRDILSCLHSIVVVPDTDENPVRLIHPSFFDFATRRCPDPQFRINVLSNHEQLATFCFKQIKSLKRNICEIKDASKLNEEVEDLPERIERYLPHALRYACLHWIFHICGSAESLSLQTSLYEFCHKKLLYWIEVLSLIGPGSLRDGIRHLKALQTHLTNYSSLPNELLTILKDALTFMTYYFDFISPASLQLYRSALPLSSPSNSLCKLFSCELGGGVRVLRRAQEIQYPGVTVLRGHLDPIYSAEFSPDGTLVVSSGENEVRLWDRGTGTLSKILRMDQIIIWVKFLPCVERIFSGSDKGSICIWDVKSGTLLKTIQLEECDEIFPYNCSPDLTRIIGSVGCDVMIWDLSSGSLLNTLRGHEGVVESIAFSQNHMLIASGSKDGTIRLWDAVSGDHLKTLTVHSAFIISVSFLPCSNYLVSGSWEKDIRLWDISRGITSKFFTERPVSVCSIAVSSDGTQIISGSYDGEMRVWNVVDGKLLKSLRLGKGLGGVRNVGFSFDGSHYICTWRGDIYIWDADRASDLDRLEEQFDDLKFSPDGTLLIAITKEEVHLLDGLTSDSLKVLKGHSGYIRRPEISPNNQYVALLAWSTIYLWYISSSTAPRLLKGHSKHIFSVAFSSDSTQLVSAAEDNTLRIWDTASGDNIFTVEADHHPHHPAYFSPDGTQINPRAYQPSAYFSPDGAQIIVDTLYLTSSSDSWQTIPDTDRYNIPPNIHSDPMPLNEPVAEQLQYSIAREWVFASRGDKKERCIWLPVDWRWYNDVSRSGRLAIGTCYGLVLLDLSSITLSI